MLLRRKEFLIAIAIITFLLAINLLFRHYLEAADVVLRSHPGEYFRKVLTQVYEKPLLDLLLPIPEFRGTWNSTSYVLLYPLEQRLGGPAGLYYLLNFLIIIASYMLSWFTFRSRVFSMTLALCFALTTFNYHVYPVSGSIAVYFIITYLLLTLMCLFKLFAEPKHSKKWLVFYFFSLIIFALSYEGWLSFLVYLGAATPLIIWFLYKCGDIKKLKHFLAVSGGTLSIGISYVIIKISYAAHTPGVESDPIFNYTHLSLAIDDLVSNFFTVFYTVITTYIPPYFTSSNSLWMLGKEVIIAEQMGYHSVGQDFTYMNHVFLWRFFAGILATVCLYGLFKLLRRAIIMKNVNSLIFGLLLGTVFLGSAPHILVKFRPMHSLPHMAYHFYFGVVGLTLLIAFFAYWIQRNVRRAWLRRGIISLIWLNVLICALTRPAMLGDMNQQLSLGTYPDPLKALEVFNSEKFGSRTTDLINLYFNHSNR